VQCASSILSSGACLALENFFSRYPLNGIIFEKKKKSYCTQNYVAISSTTSFER